MGSLIQAMSANNALSRDSAFALLNRSIAFGHRQLAVVRLLTAVRCGVDLPQGCRDYCRDVAAGSRDLTLQALFVAAAEQSRTCTLR